MFESSAAKDYSSDYTDPVGSNEAETSELEDSLAAYIRARFNEALLHRRRIGIDGVLAKCLRTIRREFTAEELQLFEGIDIYPGLSALKARAGKSWITDILLNSMDKPWTLSPTPVPDLPEWQKDQIVKQLLAEIAQLGLADMQQVRDRARDLKQASLQDAQEAAQHAVEGMERLVEDQLLEGGWRDAFDEFISDLMIFPAAFLRAPIVEVTRQIGWDGNQAKAIDKPLMRVRRVDPFDVYPSPDSTDTQNGHYIIERARMTPERLYSAIGVPGFSEDAIRYILERYKNGFTEFLLGDSEQRKLEELETPLLELRTLDTLIYNGSIPGRFLLSHGVLVADPERQYEVEVWTVAGYTIKAVINPDVSGIRPIFSTSYNKVNGSFWGDSIVSLLFGVERSYDSFIRAALKNASFSSGPFGEVNTERLGEDEAPNEVQPYKLYQVAPEFAGMGGGQPAFTFHDIPNHVSNLLEGSNYFYKLADDISGIPAYVMGAPQVQGGGRTLGGLSMLMGNAAKGIKSVALNIDKDVIEKICTLYYNFNMVTSDDPDIKADAKVVARGASGLLQRELAQSKMTDILQLLTPYAQMPINPNGIIPTDLIRQVISQVLQSTGMDIRDSMPDPRRAQNLAMDLQGAGISTAMARGAGQPVPLPPQSIVPSQKPTPINLPQGS